VHLRVLARRERLDRQLLKGADPVSTPELTLRAYQLTRAASRTALAATLEASLTSAATGQRRSMTAAPLARGAIESARGELDELARTLREPVVAARGVVLARRLLTDGAGPLYVEDADGELARTAAEALRALGAHA
jgi:hypothetical protein